MTTLAPPQCLSCVHLDDTTVDDPDIPTARCAAFPNGIPAAIWESRRDHRQPFRGDHGIRFQLEPGVDPYPFDLFIVDDDE